MSMVHGHHHGGDLVGLNQEELPGDVDPQSWGQSYQESENYPTDVAQDFNSALPDPTQIEFPAIDDEEQRVRSESSLDVLGSGLQESEDNGDDQAEESEEADDQSKMIENSGINAVPTTDMHSSNSMSIDHGYHHGGDVLVGLNPEVPPGDVDHQSWGHSYQESDNHQVWLNQGVPLGYVNHQSLYHSYQESDNHQVGLNQESDAYTTDSAQDSYSAVNPDQTVIEYQAPTQDDEEQRESIFDVVGSGLDNDDDQTEECEEKAEGDDQTEESEEDAEGDDQTEESEEKAEGDDQTEESEEKAEGDVQSEKSEEDAGGDGDSYEAKIKEDAVQVPWTVRQPGDKPQGVTFHKINKVWEAHLWITGVKLPRSNRNGVQVFLGCYKTEDEAKHAHDRAAIRFKKRKTNEGEPYALNFPESAQAAFMAEFGKWSLRDFVWNLRRHSLTFSTGKCRTKGVTMRTPRKQQTMYEAKISHTDLDEVRRTWCLGRFDTEEDAGKAYDKALMFIKRHKTEVEKWHVISNFKPSSYAQPDIRKAGLKLKPKPT